MALVSVARRLSGQYSLISVTAFGMAAPRPMPVTKRQTVNACKSAANEDSRQPTANTSTDSSSTRLRPQRSAIGPADSAPAARPNNAALSTGASAGLVTPHSLISDGAM